MSTFRFKVFSFGLLGTVAAAGIGLTVMSLQAQAKKTPAVETLLPGNAVVYVGWDGSDAHRQAFEKTAAYKALYETGLVEVLTKSITFAGSKIPGENANAMALLKKTYMKVNGKGLSLAVSVTADVGPPKPQFVMVMHEGADLADDIGKFLTKASQGELQYQTKKIAGRSVTRATIPAEGAPFDLEIGWWTEGKHLVFAAGADAISSAISVADGKSPNITTNPLWKKYRAGKSDFEVASVAWFDMGGLRKMFGNMPIPAPGAQPGLTANKILKTVGLHNVGAAVCRTGYRGAALWSKTTVECPGKKTGLLALADQKPIGMSDLPPLPGKTNGFYACSLDASKSFDVVMGLIKAAAKLGPEGADVQAEAIIDQIPAIIGFDPQEDLFKSLGQVACVYGDPGQGPFGIGVGAVIAVKDAKTLRKTINDILERVGDIAPDGQFNVERTKKHGREIITLEIGGGAVSPAFAIDDNWMVVGVYPQTVEAFLLRVDGKLPKWSPGADYQKALADVPKQFTSIMVSDPRETYRMILGLAPAFVPILKMGMKQAGLGDDLPISIADFPPTEVVTQHLFPNVTVCTVDDAGIHWTARTSLPSVPLLAGGNSVGTSAVLAALLLPAVQQAREAARRSQSKNNLKQLAIAVHNYHETHGRFPQGTHPNAKLKPEKRLSWMATILPYMEQSALHRQLDFKQAWDSKTNSRLAKSSITPFLNPGVVDNGTGTTHYVGIGGVGKGTAALARHTNRTGVFGYNRITRFRDITDGTSNTIMMTEASKNFGPWAAGGKSTILELTSKPYINGKDGIGGPYRGGCHVLLADGSVRFVSEHINPKVFEYLNTIRGGEVVGGGF